MDMVIKELFDDLENHISDDWICEYEDNIINAITDLSDRESYIPLIYEIMEKYPLKDWGMPGSFVHFLESFGAEKEETYLVNSIKRQPTRHTVWMLNRLLNSAECKKREEYLVILCDIAKNESISKAISNSAQEFLDYQEKTDIPIRKNDSFQQVLSFLGNMDDEKKDQLSHNLRNIASDSNNLKNTTESINLLGQIFNVLTNGDGNKS